MSYKKELLTIAHDEGFDYEGHTGKGHYVFVCKRNGRKTFAPNSPTNAWRTLKNVRGQMRSTARC